MRGQSVILNVLTLVILAASACMVAFVALLFVAPGIVPAFLRLPTAPVQLSGLTAQPTATVAAAYPTLPPEWTATPSPQPSSTDTAEPIQTATSTPSPAATDTAAASTPVPSAAASTATATVATSANMITIARQANVRSGPSLAYPIVTGLKSGQTEPVVGRDSSSQWFAISIAGAPQGIGWVSAQLATYAGSIGDLPVIQAAAPPPPPTAVPATRTPTATNTPVIPNVNGIQTIDFHMEQTTGSVNQNLWFDFDVVNITGSDITYGILAAHTDAGVTADSWHEPLLAGKEKQWRDHINFPNTGSYQVYLGICYSSHDPCKTGGAPWTHLSNSVTVTIN